MKKIVYTLIYFCVILTTPAYTNTNTQEIQNNWSNTLNNVVRSLQGEDIINIKKWEEKAWYKKIPLNEGDYYEVLNLLRNRLGEGLFIRNDLYQWNSGGDITFVIGPTDALRRWGGSIFNPTLEAINEGIEHNEPGTLYVIRRTSDRIVLASRVPVEPSWNEPPSINVDVPSGSSTGTGFFVSNNGHILTSNHVIRGRSNIQIVLNDRLVDARLVSSNPTIDLALLKIEQRSNPISLASLNNVNMGDDVYTIGFPNLEIQGMSQKLTRGHINSMTGMRDNPIFMQISVPIQPGNSGGPLLNARGQLVGVIAARLNDMTTYRNTGVIPQNVNYAIRTDRVLQFLESTGINFSNNRSMNVNDISNSVVLIIAR